MDIAPHAGDAFLVLDRALSVCAVSRGAERLLATREPDAVNRHVSDLLMPADAEEGGGDSLSVAVAWAARGDGGTRTTVVRPANTFGIRITARIASCGPPRAALLVRSSSPVTARARHSRQAGGVMQTDHFLRNFAGLLAALAVRGADLDNSG